MSKMYIGVGGQSFEEMRDGQVREQRDSKADDTRYCKPACQPTDSPPRSALSRAVGGRPTLADFEIWYSMNYSKLERNLMIEKKVLLNEVTRWFLSRDISC